MDVNSMIPGRVKGRIGAAPNQPEETARYFTRSGYGGVGIMGQKYV